MKPPARVTLAGGRGCASCARIYAQSLGDQGSRVVLSYRWRSFGIGPLQHTTGAAQIRLYPHPGTTKSLEIAWSLIVGALADLAEPPVARLRPI